MSNAQQILHKYNDIIAEEVNVKQVSLLPSDMQITKTYVPIWKELSESFWKDTGRIIGAAKQGNAKELPNWQLEVFQWDENWVLEPFQYETRYSGIDETNQIVEDGVVVSLDLHLTQELKAEWVAREVSRFLNQMRKEADYKVDMRVSCYYFNADQSMIQTINQFEEFLKQEALLLEISWWSSNGEITKILELPEWSISFTLKA